MAAVSVSPDLSSQTRLWSSRGLITPTDQAALQAALADLRQPLLILREASSAGWGNGSSLLSGLGPVPTGFECVGMVPALSPDRLGDPAFLADHGLRYPYVSGAMAHGIGSEEIAEQMASIGCLGIFGAAGLSINRVEQAIDRLQRSLGHQPFGINLIHSPSEGSIERGVVELFLRRSVRLIEASAFLDLTPNVVRYRLTDLHVGPDGRVVAPNRVIAKVSRVEVASKFLAPAPAKIVSGLLEAGLITTEQARLSQYIAMADDITAEADSGGHTDNRPAITLIPTLVALRDQLQQKYQFAKPVRIGAAGGISTPASAAAAFSLGAAYVLVGSVHQGCVESGSSEIVRQMLAAAEQADCTMCPCADMFEMGVKVQVLKRGTMFPMRATKLYEMYRSYSGIDAIPPADLQQLEQNVFRMPISEVWKQTREFFLKREPAHIERAERDPKHLMALCFRWYISHASRWANSGEPTRRMDYQIWCGPAMGAFNEWTKGSFLAEVASRQVATVAWNLLYGATYLQRVQSLRSQGISVPPAVAQIAPQTRESLRPFFDAAF